MTTHAHSTALERFIPLMRAIEQHPGTLPVRLDVENTGGGIMCLFIRLPESERLFRNDRCLVISDEWDEPDPTAQNWARVSLYRDWTDPEDVADTRRYESFIRQEHDNEPAIADWLMPLINGWLR